MPVFHVIVVLLVLGLAWWLFATYVLPHVPDPFKTIIIIVLALAAICWLLSLVGVIPAGTFRW